MVKYKDYGRKILAVLLAIATVLTTSSIDLRALAAPEPTSTTIYSGGYLGEIYTNNSSTQKVNSVSFDMIQVAGIPYDYTAYIYENPTVDGDPQSGVIRKVVEKSIDTSAETVRSTINIPIGNGDDNKPIVLTNGEKLGVAIMLSGNVGDNPIQYYETGAPETGNGYRKDTSTSGWEKRGDIVTVSTENAGEPYDLTDITMNPTTTFLTVGDDDVALNTTFTPNYKRTIAYESSDETIIKRDGQKVHAVGSGQARLTASYGDTSTYKDFTVFQNTIIDQGPWTYTGSEIKPRVKVECGRELTENTDYRLTYSNCINPGTASVTITGLGTYAGYSKTYNYTIDKATLTQEMVNSTKDGGTATYTIDTSTGEVKSAVIESLVKDRDFTAVATYVSSSVDKITYDVTVTAKGNYKGDHPFTTSVDVPADPSATIDINYVVDAVLIDGEGNETDEFIYTGGDITPGVKFFLKGTDTPVSFANNVEIEPSGGSTASEDKKTLTITGKNLEGYSGTITLDYWVVPLDIEDAKISVDVQEETPGSGNVWIHTGNQIKPTVTVKYTNGTTSTLTLGKDYEVHYSNNTSVGTARIEISGIGNFTGTRTEDFEIIADFVKDASLKLGGYTANYSNNFVTGYSVTYRGTPYTTKPTNFQLAGKSVKSTDYRTEYSNNTDAGTAEIKYIGLNKYAGKEFTVKFTITPKQLTSGLTVYQQAHTYSGNHEELSDGEYVVYDGSKPLIKGTDYDVSFTNDINAGTASIKVTGKGNYDGTLLGTYTIDPLSISDGNVTIEPIKDRTYTGAAQEPPVVVKLNGVEVPSSNYTVSYSNNINVGTANVTLTGKGNFTGSRNDVTFKINPKTLAGLEYTIGGVPCTKVSETGTSYTSEYVADYTGLEVKPAVVVYDGGNVLTSDDYTVSYSGNINVGTATARVSGRGSYAGSTVYITFNIDYKSIENTNVTLTGTKKVNGIIYPTVTVYDPTAPYGAQDLVEGTHYEIIATATHAGAGNTAIIRGIGNYRGEQKVTYNIGHDLNDDEKTSVQVWTPNGNVEMPKESTGVYVFEYIGEQYPSIKVFYDGSVLTTNDFEYSLERLSTNDNDFDAGTRIKVTVTGKGDNYYNSKSAQYNISRKNINDSELIAITDDNNNSTKTADWIYTYDRLAKVVKPKIVYNVKDGAAVTLTDSDYTKDKDSVGPNVLYDGELIKSTPVTLTGTGNYMGTVTLNYTINPCALSDTDVINVVDIGDQQYTGEQIRPLPVVQHTLSDASTRELVNGTDYELTYANNTDVADISSEKPPTVIITAKDRGNYTGQVIKKFNIIQRTLTQTNTTVTPIQPMIYDGTPKTPTQFSVYYNETGNVLTTDDYDVVPVPNTNVLFGVGDVEHNTGPRVMIIGKGKYKGTVYAPFTIKANIGDSSLFIIDGLEETYNIVKNGDVFDINVGAFTVKYEDPNNPGQFLIMDPDLYELKKPQTIVPGLAQLSVVGKGGIVYGTANKPVKLVGNLEDVTLSGIDPVYDYTGTAITPSPTVMFGTKLLTEGVDYNLSYSNNTNAGTATISITPVGGNEYLTGSKSVNFKIQYNMDEAVISGYESSYPYTGNQWTPNPITVTVHGNTLSNGTDYDVVYGHNTDVSEGGIITVTGKGEKARGTKSVQFRITPVSIENAQVTFAATYPYTGQSQRPVPDVEIGNKTLTEGVDFRVDYPTDTVNVGFKPVNIVGMGNYTGRMSGDITTDPMTWPYYHIGVVSLTDSAVTIEVQDAYYAGGENVTPPYSVKYNGIPLVKDRDYTVTMSGTHAAVGTNYSITFTGINNFNGAVDKTYAIREADLSKGVVKLSETSHEYTGSPIVPRIVATIDKGDGTVYTLKEGADKDYVVTFNGGQAMIDVGTYSILVEGKNNFINSLSETYTVTAKDLSDSSKVKITYDIDNEYQEGAEVRPAPKVWDIARGVQLVEGTDYTVTYDNNKAAASKDSALPPTITVVGLGNYTGTFSGTFNIGHPLGSLEIVLDSYQYTYDGQLHVPGVQVKRGNTVLVEGVDYEKSYSNFDGSALDANAGKKSVNITGHGGYYSDSSRTYDIVAKVANANMIKIDPSLLKDESGNYYTVYTGTDIEPAVTIYDEEISSAIPVDPSNYDVAYVRNKDMSTPTNPALIKIVFKNNYAMGAESYTMPFYIKAKTIEAGFEAYLPGGSQYAYTGNEVEPEVIVKPTSLDTVEGELIEGVDYTLTYINNVNAGTANVVVTGINNYSGEVVLPYNVVANLNDSTIIAPDQFYTGSEVHAPLTITCGGNSLVEGVDYTVTYTSDDNWQTRGTATITSLQPYYAGTATKDYNILFDPTILKVVGYANEYSFTGGPIKPDFKVVTPDGQEIPYNPEDITYYNSSTGFGDCTSIGTVTATIPLNIGDKACELKAVYDIIGRNINLCNIVPLYDNVYTGNKLYPPVIIRNEQGDLLTEGVDYTLEYSNNIYPGVGKIVITGKGNYIASVTKYFNIIAPNMLGLTAAPEGDNAVKLSWLRNARITGYEIYSGDCSVKYGSTSDTTFTVTGLKQATDYEFKVRTYITANGRTSYGEFKSVTSHSGMGKPEITVQSLARQRATINWTSAGNVSGYEIYRGSSATGTFSKIAVMPSSAGGYSDSNLVSGGTYYYKVRAYDKVGENQFVYGYFSDPKAVTIR